MMDQGKQKKLQKGYVLEPVIPTYTDDSSLPDKRERKKSSHFGELAVSAGSDSSCNTWFEFLQATVRSWINRALDRQQGIQVCPRQTR
jgi:hypothetical protein